jgi:AbrB family looped-hinge helix DNA binding protein
VNGVPTSILNAIESWFHPRHNGIMMTKLTLDKAGRVVLPKPLRDQMQLAPGDTLVIEHEGERITLRPVRPKAALKKECGIWVYQGESSDGSIPDLLDRERDKRLRESMG